MLSACVAGCAARAVGYGSPGEWIVKDKRGLLQDIVSFLAFLIFICGNVQANRWCR